MQTAKDCSFGLLCTSLMQHRCASLHLLLHGKSVVCKHATKTVCNCFIWKFHISMQLHKKASEAAPEAVMQSQLL